MTPKPRTIDSAPKDGSNVLLFTVWDGSVHCPPFSEIQMGFWEDAVDAPLRQEEAGWRKEYIGTPTHWMPLPPPPKDSHNERSEG